MWLGLGEGVSRALLIAFLIAAARVLGAHDYGMFAVGLSVASIVHMVVQFGLPALFTRESAQDQKWERAFPGFLTLTLLLGLGAAVLLGFAAFLLSVEPFFRMLYLFFGGYVAAAILLELLYAFFRARENMRYEAAGKVVQSLAILLLGALALVLIPLPHTLALVYAVGAMLALVFMGFVFVRHVPSLFRFRVDVPFFVQVLSRAWPLGAVGVFAAIFSHTDSAMLGVFGQITEAGWYNAAYRVVGLTLIPAVFLGHSFLPALSKSIRKPAKSLQALWERQVEAALFFGVAGSVGGALLAPGIIQILYTPDFEPSTLALQILVWTVVLVFLVSAGSYLLFSAGAQKQSFWIMAAGAGGNVILNFLLIPRYSLYGAAAATLITSFLLVVLYGIAVTRFTPARIRTLPIGKALIAAGGAAAVMAWVLSWTPSVPLLILILIGGGAYMLSYGILRKVMFGTLSFGS